MKEKPANIPMYDHTFASQLGSSIAASMVWHMIVELSIV